MVANRNKGDSPRAIRLTPLLGFLFAAGCGTIQGPEPSPEARERIEDFQIGLLADSQLQTGRSRSPVRFYRGKNEDLVKSVAIRPLALDRFSQDLLEELALRLPSESTLDLVLYLGDGANNGCRDELMAVLGVLREVRDRFRVPVFYVIGNHDYLGGGNTPEAQLRKRLCNDKKEKIFDLRHADSAMNEPLTKREVIELIHHFNQERSFPGWKYNDSVDVARGACTDLSEDRQHASPGCFLAGWARYTADAFSVEVLLLDTSDYAHNMPNFAAHPYSLEYYGTGGWISWSVDNDQSQLKWIENAKVGSASSLRIIASHYPSDHLSWFEWIYPGRLRDQFESFYLPRPAFGTHWVAAHTHGQPKKSSFLTPAWYKLRKRVFVNTITVGSTTDSTGDGDANTPHAALWNYGNGEPQVSAVRIDAEQCAEFLRALCASTVEDLHGYQQVGEVTAGCGLFGMDQSYLGNWTREDDVRASANLDKFLETHRDRFAERQIRVCIALEASRFEAIKLN